MTIWQPFTSARPTWPDPASLLATLQALDATATWSGAPSPAGFLFGKSTAWTAPQITAAQTALDAAAASTPELTAQTTVDRWPLELQALALALIDQLNVIRAALPVPLGAITPAAAIAAVRAKAGSL